MDELAVVASYDSEFAAQVARAHLESVGVDANVVSDDAGGAFPSLTPLGSGARVMVRSDDLERAREELQDLDPTGFDSAAD